MSGHQDECSARIGIGETVRREKTQSESGTPQRRPYRWPKEARRLVREYLETTPPRPATSKRNDGITPLVTNLVRLTGHPRDACWRFVREFGAERVNRVWTDEEVQKLVNLSGQFFLREVARRLGRTYSSVRWKLHELGLTSRMGKDWFTLGILANALHIAPAEIQRWIDCGWLKAKVVRTGRLKRVIITADALARFCKTHGNELAGSRRRIPWQRLEFLSMFVFPPSHADLLPVRDSKKERAAYKNQVA